MLPMGFFYKHNPERIELLGFSPINNFLINILDNVQCIKWAMCPVFSSLKYHFNPNPDNNDEIICF